MESKGEAQINQDYVDWQANVRASRLASPDASSLPSLKAAENAPELFVPDGDRFIFLAFRTFLDRTPSDAELDHYRQLLDGGLVKSAIAARIRYSPEARQRAQRISLRRAYWLDRLSSVPVAGRLIGIAAGLFSLPGMKRLLHSQQQAGARLQSEFDRHIGQTTRALFRDIVTAEERHRLDIDALTRELHREVDSLRNRQGELESRFDSMTPAGAAQFGETQGTPVDEDFYIAFENHFRGSEEVIRERLSHYLPVLEAKLPAVLNRAPMADIGCGRGEWLQVLKDHGYNARGVDLNEKNIASCREKGLDTELADGVAWLRRQPSDSLSLVSSFHVVEHLPLAQLHSLLIESLRCLMPGGLLLLETPNPENLVTAAHRFYTDPSHRHPIPPDLLEFLLKYKGFEDIGIHRLHPCEDEKRFSGDSELESRLNDLLYGPQDYAIFARKP